MAHGGVREGAGRKPKADEEKVRNLAIASIVKKYGSEEAGFGSLLESGEPSLIKFVFEHAFGKPKERIEMPNGLNIFWQEQKTYITK